MYCMKCGKEIPDHYSFCNYCGSPVDGAGEARNSSSFFEQSGRFCSGVFAGMPTFFEKVDKFCSGVFAKMSAFLNPVSGRYIAVGCFVLIALLNAVQAVFDSANYGTSLLNLVFYIVPIALDMLLVGGLLSYRDELLLAGFGARLFFQVVYAVTVRVSVFYFLFLELSDVLLICFLYLHLRRKTVRPALWLLPPVLCLIKTFETVVKNHVWLVRLGYFDGWYIIVSSIDAIAILLVVWLMQTEGAGRDNSQMNQYYY